MIRALLITALLCACGPDKSSSGKPSGSPSDPVEVCERVGDVCRHDGSKLGVCSQHGSGSGLVCASQH